MYSLKRITKDLSEQKLHPHTTNTLTINSLSVILHKPFWRNPVNQFNTLTTDHVLRCATATSALSSDFPQCNSKWEDILPGDSPLWGKGDAE